MVENEMRAAPPLYSSLSLGSALLVGSCPNINKELCRTTKVQPGP